MLLCAITIKIKRNVNLHVLVGIIRTIVISIARNAQSIIVNIVRKHLHNVPNAIQVIICIKITVLKKLKFKIIILL